MWGIENRKNSAFNHVKIVPCFEFSDSRLKSANDINYGIVTYEYDSKNNPFLNLGLLGIEGLNKNNVTKETHSYENQTDQIYSYSYEYNDNNFPTKETYSSTSNGETYTYTNLYEYTTR